MSDMPNIPRPFNPVEAEGICERISESTLGLVAICKEFKMSTLTFYKWLRDEENKINGESFEKRYTRAKEIQTDLLADEILAIADDGTNDTMTIILPNKEKKEVENREWTSRSKLRIEARKLLIEKLNPKKYGNKVQLDQNIKTVSILNLDPLSDDSSNNGT
jgi:hypothetical protein